MPQLNRIDYLVLSGKEFFFLRRESNRCTARHRRNTPHIPFFQALHNSESNKSHISTEVVFLDAHPLQLIRLILCALISINHTTAQILSKLHSRIKQSLYV